MTNQQQTARRPRIALHTALRTALIGAAAAIALIGAACSDDADSTDDTTATTTTTTATATNTGEATSTGETTPVIEATTTATATESATEGTEPADESVLVSYTCADGLTFDAEVSQVPATWAIIEVDGETIEMEQTISGSGIRYQGNGYEYQSKGEEATLLKDDEVIRANCVEAP